MLHLKVSCKKYGYVLVEWDKMRLYHTSYKRDRWYDKLYTRLKGKCPRCGHELPSPEVYAEEMKVEVMVCK